MQVSTQLATSLCTISESRERSLDTPGRPPPESLAGRLAHSQFLESPAANNCFRRPEHRCSPAGRQSLRSCSGTRQMLYRICVQAQLAGKPQPAKQACPNWIASNRLPSKAGSRPSKMRSDYHCPCVLLCFARCCLPFKSRLSLWQYKEAIGIHSFPKAD